MTQDIRQQHLNDRHLNDEQIAAALIDQDAGIVDTHLRDCPACAAKVEDLRVSLAGFGSFVRENAERSNTFWWRQRAAAPAPAVPLTRWATAAAALIVAVAASVSFIHKAAQPEQVKTPAVVRPISDEALLSEVQNDVQREYADAFAPVQTNAESAVATQRAVTAHKKEHKKK